LISTSIEVIVLSRCLLSAALTIQKHERNINWE